MTTQSGDAARIKDQVAQIKSAGFNHRQENTTTSKLDSLHPHARPLAITGLEDRRVDMVDPEAWAAMLDCGRRGDRWPLLLIGQPGTGKTYAAACMIDRVYGSRKFRTITQLCCELIAVQNGEREYGHMTDTPEKWWRRWQEISIAVLDDMGARERVSDFHYETVKRAIDDRKGKPTIITTNLEVSAIAKTYDDRIASRLAGGTIVRFKGDDRRLAATTSEAVQHG